MHITFEDVIHHVPLIARQRLQEMRVSGVSTVHAHQRMWIVGDDNIRYKDAITQLMRNIHTHMN